MADDKFDKSISSVFDVFIQVASIGLLIASLTIDPALGAVGFACAVSALIGVRQASQEPTAKRIAALLALFAGAYLQLWSRGIT